MAAIVDSASYGAYKYQWSRKVARDSLNHEVKILKDNLNTIKQVNPAELPAVDSLPEVDYSQLKLREIAEQLDKLTFGRSPKEPGKFHMGIVGSGVSGLFTAMIIDTLNEKCKLNITYDILEASGEKRLGGRLYTHKFPDIPNHKEYDTAHQYYDIGAMRFPKNEVMNRTFRLFDHLGMKADGPNPVLRPYFFVDEDKVCPSYYNDVRVWGPPGFKDLPKGLPSTDVTKADDGELDVYGVNKWLKPNDPRRISKDVIEYPPGDIVDRAIKNFTDEVKKDLDLGRKKQSGQVTGVPDKGWEYLMAADYMSVRQFLRSGKIDIPKNPDSEHDPKEPWVINGCNYNFNTVEWLETYALATGWYDQSFTEQVLEAIDFETPPVPREDIEKDPTKSNWYCIEGGSQVLARKMHDKIKTKTTFNTQVTAIDTDLSTGEITLKTKTTKPDNSGEGSFEPKQGERKYFTVFNSTTLGALQRMDLSKTNLLYGTKQAIRSLRYGASCKVGIQFKTMWWAKAPFNIKNGGLGRTDLPLRTCVYPSYNIHDNFDEPAALLCSYSWAQDAQRIGTLIHPDSPHGEEELKDLMLSNLAQLHASKTDPEYSYENLLKKLHEQYITHHAFDWYHDPNMAGAFAWFGPGQFSQMWPWIIKPNGWLFLIGEAASAHHGWVVGALESAVRAVYQLLETLQIQLWKDHPELIPTYHGYTDAMTFLEGPVDKPGSDDWKSPFIGLPREIPMRQAETLPGAPVENLPGKDVDLSFTAAQTIASFIDMIVQVVGEQQDNKVTTETNA